jgi:hypothetical protein
MQVRRQIDCNTKRCSPVDRATDKADCATDKASREIDTVSHAIDTVSHAIDKAIEEKEKHKMAATQAGALDTPTAVLGQP